MYWGGGIGAQVSVTKESFYEDPKGSVENAHENLNLKRLLGS